MNFVVVNMLYCERKYVIVQLRINIYMYVMYRGWVFMNLGVGLLLILK